MSPGQLTPLSPDLVAAWIPLALNALAIVVYAVFIFEFYRFVARRDVFELELTGYVSGVAVVTNAVRVALYALEHVVVYPLLTVVWYVFFTALLVFLTDQYSVQAILLVSMAIVTSIRVTAYYSEDLSQDLAKMLPLAMLGVVLLDGPAAISFGSAFSLVLEIPTHWRTVLDYLLFLVGLEFALRLARILVTRRLQTVPAEEDADT